MRLIYKKRGQACDSKPVNTITEAKEWLALFTPLLKWAGYMPQSVSILTDSEYKAHRTTEGQC